jgi:hypothetical protein
MTQKKPIPDKEKDLVKISLGRDNDVVVMSFDVSTRHFSLIPTDAINVADRLYELAEEVLLSDA